MNRILRALLALSILILAWSVPLAAAPGEESIELTDALPARTSR